MSQFVKGETLLCFHGRHLYEAKCLKIKITESNYTHYLIHYVGWKNSYDEWVPESRIFKYNDANLQRQKELLHKFDDQPVQRKREADRINIIKRKKIKYVEKKEKKYESDSQCEDENEGEYTCTTCKKTFSSQNDVDRHWQWHIAQLEHMQSCCVNLEQVEISKCDSCTSCFLDPGKLRGHKTKCVKKINKVTINKSSQVNISCSNLNHSLSDPTQQEKLSLQSKYKAKKSMDMIKEDNLRENNINNKYTIDFNKMVESKTMEQATNETNYIFQESNKIEKKVENNKLKNKTEQSYENKSDEVGKNKTNEVDEKEIIQVDQNRTNERDENKTMLINKYKNNAMDKNQTIEVDENKINGIDQNGTNELGQNKNILMKENIINDIDNTETNMMVESETNEISVSEIKQFQGNEANNTDHNKIIKENDNQVDPKDTCKKDENETYKTDRNKKIKIDQNRIDGPNEDQIKKMNQNELNKENRTNVNKNDTFKMHESKTDRAHVNKNGTNYLNENKSDDINGIETDDINENQTNILSKNKTDDVNGSKNNYINENEIIDTNENKIYNLDAEGTNEIAQNKLNENESDRIDVSQKKHFNDNEFPNTHDNKKNDLFSNESHSNKSQAESVEVENINKVLFVDNIRKYSHMPRVKSFDLYKYLEMHNLSLRHVRSCYVKLSKVKISKCNFCSSCFPDPQTLRIHQRKYFQRNGVISKKKNEAAKPFECEVCGWRFMAKSTLKAHVVVHEPFPNICFCGIGYYKKCDLDAHKKLVHPNYKPSKVDPTPKHPKIKIKNELKREFTPDDEFRPHKKLGPRLKASLTYKQRKSKKKTNKLRIKIREPQQSHVKNELEIETDENGNYSCTICTQTFLIADDLVAHLLRDHCKKVNGGYMCKICGKTRTQVSNLKFHMFSHAGMRPFVCKICNGRYSQVGALQLHQKRHAGDRQFQCEFCKKTFYNQSSLVLHSRVHTGEKPFECRQCGKGFSDPSAYRRHLAIHTGLKKYKCQICPKAFCDPAALFRHNRLHDGYKVPCIACDRTFGSKDNMLKHYRVIHSQLKEEEKYECDHCSHKFSLKGNLATHIRRVHLRLGPEVECKICGNKFTHNEGLKRHLRDIHIGITRYECDICGKRFIYKNLMKAHKSRVHRSKNMEKGYECDHCHKSFYIKRDLAKHITYNHLGFKCKTCNLSFPSYLKLKQHKAIGCLRCRVCNKPFPTRGRLNDHFTVKHLNASKQEIYECDYCGKQFPIKSILAKHLKTHQSLDAFRCHHCDKAFAVRGAIVKHIWESHMVSLYCNLCMKRFYREHEFIEHKRAANCHIRQVACKICNKTISSKASLKVHLLHHLPRRLECDMCGDKFTLKRGLARHIRLVHLNGGKRCSRLENKHPRDPENKTLLNSELKF